MKPKGLKALREAVQGPDRDFTAPAPRSRWKTIELTEKQARAYFETLTYLFDRHDTAVEIARITNRIPKYRQRDLFELRRRLLIAGLNPRDRWPE